MYPDIDALALTAACGHGFPRDAQLADQLSVFGLSRRAVGDEALERLMTWAEDPTRPQAERVYVRARLVDLREA